MSKRRKKAWGMIILTVVVWLAIFIPLAFPIGLPLYVSDMTKEFRGYLDEVAAKEEPIVIHDCETYAGSLIGTADVIKYCIAKGIKWVGWSGSTRGTAYTTDALGRAGAFAADKAGTWVHGVDWLWLGYLPGAEAVHMGIRDDFKSVTTVDYLERDITGTELYLAIDSAADADMFIGSGEGCETWGRLWPTKAPIIGGIPTIIVIPTDFYPVALPYYPSLASAILNGDAAAAQFEYLTGMPGRGISSADALSAATICNIIAIVIAQIETVAGKKVERAVRVEEES